MIGYKVLKKNMGSFADIPKEYRVTYKLNSWVKPKVEGTRLFFFKTLEEADNFCHYAEDKVIFKCEAKNVAKIKYIGYVDSIVKFWQFKLKKKKRNLGIFNKSAPLGSYSASEIKLLERVQ